MVCGNDILDVSFEAGMGLDFEKWLFERLYINCTLVNKIDYPPPRGIELLCISTAMRYAVFFYVGMCFRRFVNVQSLMSLKSGYMLCGIVILVGVELVLWHYSLALLLAFTGITISIAVALLFDRYIPKIFSLFRNYTYQIYLMGIFIQILVKMLYKRDIFPSYFWGYALCILCGLYIPVLIAYIARKLDIEFIKLCLGLSK